eukprot:symbB.v1.2.023326.t2/scaffold2128.1/size88402/4
MGRCSAVLCEVGDDGRRVPVTLGTGVKTGCMGGPSATSPDVSTAYLRGADRHSFLVLSSSMISNSISSTELMNISLGYELQPRAFCGDVASRAAQAGPCTAVQVNFLPETPAQVEAVPPPAKKAKVVQTSGATQSMRLRHILVKFHEGPKIAEDPKAKWASRSRLDAEKILRGAIAEIRQDRKGWKKPPKDVTEMISLSSKKFIELARKHSDCETAQKGALACGDLGWVTPEARAAMSEHFKEVCDVLHPGQWSDIVPVGTKLYGLMPASRYQVQTVGGTIPGKKGEPSYVELAMEDVPFNLRRFQEMEVQSRDSSRKWDGHNISWLLQVISEGLEPHLEDWIISTKEIYTMAYYMDEQLLVDTGMINCVIISCASAKTALALAFCLRMRDMRQDHLEFTRSTDLFHEVFSYDDVESLPNNHTVVYMDFKCDGELRQQITMRMGTNLMYNMVIGPAVFQKKMKDQIFEKRAREVLFDESSWRERRRLVAEVTKTGRNEKLKHSYQAFIERMKRYITVKQVAGVDDFVGMYNALYSNASLPSHVHVCSLHSEDETPSESASESLLAWLQQAFDVANHAFFNGELQGVQIEIDNSWHLRGGAGGAHPGKQCIVLDPSVHLCYRDLCATLLHEMLHLQVGDADREEHGPVFLQACMELNTTLMESGAACFCRLGEFDTALDQSLLAKAGTPVDVRDALLHGRPSSSDSWDSKLLVGDLCFFCDEAGLPEEKALELAARIQCLAVVTSCKIALQKGYVTWSLRSRTMARHCASNVGRDYQSFPDYAALWLL